MRRQRIFLLDAHLQDARSVAELERGLSAQGLSVARLVVPPSVADGTDYAVIDILNQVRKDDALQTNQTDEPAPQRILVGWGLSGSLALWLCALDAERPKAFSVGRSSIMLDVPDPDFPHVFDGVIALCPFLGFDFRAGLGQAPMPWWRGLQFRFFKSGIGQFFAAGVPAPDLRPYGCAAGSRFSWQALVRSVFSCSVTEILPALKRPTLVGIQSRSNFDRMELQLSVLKKGVCVLDCPADSASRLQATLQAVDFLRERLPDRP